MSEQPDPRSKGLLAVAWVWFLAASFVIAALSELGPESAQIIANGAYVAVGTLLVVHRSGNIIGPLLIVNGLGWNLVFAAQVAADELGTSGHIEAAGWIGIVSSGATALLLWLFVVLWLVFPHGRTESVAIRRLIRAAGGYAAVVGVLHLFARPWLFDPTARPYAHPFLDDDVADSVADLVMILVVPLLAMQIVAVVMLIARSRHASPVERRQIGWVVLAGLVYFAISIINVAFEPLASVDNGFLLVDAIGFLLVPIAMGIAIMRYRLYEIDTIINRSLVFGALAAFIAGVYIAIVVGVGELLGGDAGFGLSIVATVMVAMAFQPIRRRVERWANRLVYGDRATPYEVLVRFSRRSAELSDEELLERVPQLIVDGTGAATATLWTRSGHGFRTGSVWPADAARRRIDDEDSFIDPEADYSVPVVHDSELLGGISLVKAAGETVSPADESLLGDLASGLGLALRNARLTGQLRRQVAELEASRERVLEAADQARRTLEQDLDSGPQQQLVALKVKLGPTRKRAEQLGAEKTSTLLAQLESDAGEAIKAIRDFAGGIYPPLLEAEGLAVAIGQQARQAAIPVLVNPDGVGRYSRDVEAAVYFSVLEALQNTAKYAEASAAAVTLGETEGTLSFEVRDDGNGFDSTMVEMGAGLTGIADRLDTVGGRVDIDSAPGDGTVVSGSVPISALASV